MPNFAILGTLPDMQADDSLEMVDEIARYDLVTFVRPEQGRLLMRVVAPDEYAEFQGCLYQVDHGEEEGTIQLRQVKMQFWPWEEDTRMNVHVQNKAGTTYLEARPGRLLITEERDAVDLVGLCGEHDTSRLMLHADNVSEQFFDLKTQLAGRVLQKFVNYGVKAVLVLSPERHNHERFDEMALEATKGRHFGVFSDREQAEQWLLNA